MSYIPTSYQFDNSTVDTSNIWVANAPNTGVANLSTSATLSLHGEGADIVVNGESLMETLKEIKKELQLCLGSAKGFCQNVVWIQHDREGGGGENFVRPLQLHLLDHFDPCAHGGNVQFDGGFGRRRYFGLPLLDDSAQEARAPLQRAGTRSVDLEGPRDRALPEAAHGARLQRDTRLCRNRKRRESGERKAHSRASQRAEPSGSSIIRSRGSHNRPVSAAALLLTAGREAPHK